MKMVLSRETAEKPLIFLGKEATAIDLVADSPSTESKRAESVCLNSSCFFFQFERKWSSRKFESSFFWDWLLTEEDETTENKGRKQKTSKNEKCI